MYIVYASFIYSAPRESGPVLGTECAVMGEIDNRETCVDDWGGLACWLGEKLAVSAVGSHEGFWGREHHDPTYMQPSGSLLGVSALSTFHEPRKWKCSSDLAWGPSNNPEPPLTQPTCIRLPRCSLHLVHVPRSFLPSHSFKTPPWVSWSPLVFFASPPPSHLYAQRLGLSGVLSFTCSFSVP